MPARPDLSLRKVYMAKKKYHLFRLELNTVFKFCMTSFILLCHKLCLSKRTWKEEWLFVSEIKGFCTSSGFYKKRKSTLKAHKKEKNIGSNLEKGM